MNYKKLPTIPALVAALGIAGTVHAEGDVQAHFDVTCDHTSITVTGAPADAKVLLSAVGAAPYFGISVTFPFSAPAARAYVLGADGRVLLEEVKTTQLDCSTPPPSTTPPPSGEARLDADCSALRYSVAGYPLGTRVFVTEGGQPPFGFDLDTEGSRTGSYKVGPIEQAQGYTAKVATITPDGITKVISQEVQCSSTAPAVAQPAQQTERTVSELLVRFGPR